MVVVDALNRLADLFHHLVLDDFVENESDLIGNFHLLQRHLRSLLVRQIPNFAGAGGGFEFRILLRPLLSHDSVHGSIDFGDNDVVIRDLADDGFCAGGNQANLCAEIFRFLGDDGDVLVLPEPDMTRRISPSWMEGVLLSPTR